MRDCFFQSFSLLYANCCERCVLSGKKLKESDIWKIACEAMLFPRLFIVVIPFVIFISLFFIPVDYDGITRFSKTMHGSYQNKWLFDCLYITSILFFVNTVISEKKFPLVVSKKNARFFFYVIFLYIVVLYFSFFTFF